MKCEIKSKYRKWMSLLEMHKLNTKDQEVSNKKIPIVVRIDEDNVEVRHELGCKRKTIQTIKIIMYGKDGRGENQNSFLYNQIIPTTFRNE